MVKHGRLLVIGATGDVGLGIVSAALASGRSVVAAGRSADKLDELAASEASERLAVIVGDIATEAGATALWEEAVTKFGGIDAVVVAVNAPARLQPLMEMDVDELSAIAAANLFTHFIAAKTFLPRLSDDGLCIGIGGGTADFIVPKMTFISMMQAALRMMYRGIARERKGGAELRELMIVSMVNGRSKRERAQPEWLTEIEVGRHVCAILDRPDEFPGPILKLTAREQEGRSEREV